MSDCHSWPRTTPSGYTYDPPVTYQELKDRHVCAALAVIENWDKGEEPPEPTWEMVGIAHQEVERIAAELERWKETARQYAENTDYWRKRYEESNTLLTKDLQIRLDEADKKVKELESRFDVYMPCEDDDYPDR